jgi:taurine dioxygenase
MLKTHPLSPVIGVEVRGVDLRREIDAPTFAEIRGLLNRHSLLLFRDQAIDDQQHIAFSRRFGELMIHVLKQYLTTPYPEIYVLSNVVEQGKPIGAHKEGWNWHSDLSYMAEPSLGSALYGLEVPPEGGDTRFASLHAAYDALPAAMQARIRGLKAVHSYQGYYASYFPDRAPLTEEQKARVPDVVHPVVRTHPETGRPVLYVGQDIVKEIVGLAPAESRALLAELNAHAVSERFVYQHKWRAGDLIVWDNRATMHQATPYDDVKYRRVMHRTTIKGDRPF